MVQERDPVHGSPGAVRVMHVVFALQPGGMELGVIKVVNGLDPARVRSAICSTRRAGELKRLVRDGVGVFELGGRQGNDPGVVLKLFRLFRSERPDIVHTHGWGTLLEGLIAARMARVPTVVHGEHGTLQLRPYQRWVQRVAWGRTDSLLSVSTRLAHRIAEQTRFPLDRITTIRNGVDLSRFGHVARLEARAALGLDPEQPVAGTVGRLVPVKDHVMLVDAIGLLHQQGLSATLLLAGDGPLRAVIEARVSALGLANGVRLLGHRPDVECVLPALDVFVLSSQSEGLSNTILEAMASGLPVVATHVGGADELVVDGVTGVLVPARAPQRMAAALGTLLRDASARQAMGRVGRTRAETEFSLLTMMKRYEALYVELARTRRGGTASACVDPAVGREVA